MDRAARREQSSPTPPQNTRQSRLLCTLHETADLTGWSQRSLWRLIARGELKTARCGRAVRITRASIDEFIARGGTAK